MAVDRLNPLPRRLLGLFMIALVVALLALCGAFYNKAFTRSVPVTMRIDQLDNSFLPQAEVRMRGVTVGTVSEVTTDGREATLTLDLQPGQVRHIPRNVTARLLPKSLFGERYVDLESPPNPAPQPIRAGDVISRDRSSSAIEIETVFNNLLPLLQAVHPEDLATTLSALDQAFQGRGGQIGQTITQLHQYLGQLNPALPDLTQDVRELPGVTDTYTKAAPDLIEGLDNLNTTSQTLVEKQDEFATLYSTLTGTSNDLSDFLDRNGDNLVDLAHTARPTLELLARYSPEYVCFFQRMADAVPKLDKAFGKGTARPALRITAELVINRGKYVPHQDEPEFLDNRGPRCYDNTPPLPQYPGGPAQDGSTHPPASPQLSQLGALIASSPTGADGDTAVPGVPLLGGPPSDQASPGDGASGDGASGDRPSGGALSPLLGTTRGSGTGGDSAKKPSGVGPR